MKLQSIRLHVLSTDGNRSMIVVDGSSQRVVDTIILRSAGADANVVDERALVNMIELTACGFKTQHDVRNSATHRTTFRRWLKKKADDLTISTFGGKADSLITNLSTSI